MGRPAGPTIGILSPYLAGYFYGSLISTVQRVVSATGGRVVAVSTSTLGPGDQHRLIGGHFPRVSWGHVAGFISITNAVKRDYLEDLRRDGKPVVTLSHLEPGFAGAAVLTDNRGGVRRAVEHLLAHGHTRISFAGCLEQFDARERYASYLASLQANGIEPDPALFFEVSDNEELGGWEAARLMRDAGLPCTAVIAGDDMIAIGMTAALKQAGLRLPRDLAVIGFDDMAGANLLSPGLTTVAQRLGTMGALAADLVLRQVEGEVIEPGPRLVEAALMVRESCGCASRPVVPSSAGPDHWAGPVEGFVEELSEAWAGARTPGLEPVLAKVGQLARSVESAFQTAADRALTELELLDLGQVCQAIHALLPGQPTRDALSALALRLNGGGPEPAGPDGPYGTAVTPRPEVALRLYQCVAEVRLALSAALLGELYNTHLETRRGRHKEHLISGDLLRGHETDPASLAWVARTDATAAVLALWQQARGGKSAAPALDNRGPGRQTGPGPATGDNGGDIAAPGRRLEVAGIFGASGDELALRSRVCTAELFPPQALLDKVGPDNVVLVFPVGNGSRQWGLLAVVLPVTSGHLALDDIFEWEGLLAEALDYRDAVRSLRAQREQLERSYERERHMAQAVKESEERYALAAKAANDGLWDWDIATGTVYYSARWKRMLGYAQGAIGESPQEWLGRAHPEDRQALLVSVDALQNGHRTSLSYEHRILAADGTYRWVLCRGLAVPGGGRPAKRIVGFLTDIEEQRSLEERLRHQALHDELTGLPNRVLFVDRLSHAIADAGRRRRNGYAVFWLDLDGFKVLNDSLGHVTGDKLLVKVADRIRSHMRETDTAARFGGDEFALLIHGIPDLVSVRTVARRLLAHLNEPYDLGGHSVVITASLGIAVNLPAYKRPEEILRDADIAMYKAKADRPGGFVIFDPAMYEGAMVRMDTETRLRRALEMGQLELHYQPVVYLRNRQIVALEALVRWRDPVAGLVPPLKFIPVAEESGLIVPLGRWVRHEAWRQLAAWQSEGLLDSTARVGVNLSHREFWDPQLVDGIEVLLAETGARAESLILEITEGVVMENLDQALGVLRRVKDLGIQVSIDDFGTGYSSLQALHELPIDSLKIDRSFVSGLGNNKRSIELVRTIIQMGRNLGVRVVAEGVETAAEADVLMQLKCILGQGFLYHHPLPAAEASALLAAQARTGYGTVPPQAATGAR
jgi:diguanylate cyclase (GGDEF)-like protein/PAS domain S-box-containing protein